MIKKEEEGFIRCLFTVCMLGLEEIKVQNGLAQIMIGGGFSSPNFTLVSNHCILAIALSHSFHMCLHFYNSSLYKEIAFTLAYFICIGCVSNMNKTKSTK